MTLHHRAQVFQRVELNLAHALSCHANLAANFLEGQPAVPVQAEAALDDRALFVAQLEHPTIENGVHAFPLRTVRGLSFALRGQ